MIKKNANNQKNNNPKKYIQLQWIRDRVINYHIIIIYIIFKRISGTILALPKWDKIIDTSQPDIHENTEQASSSSNSWRQ